MDASTAMVEELAVSIEAASRLITLPALVEAMRWTREPRELADELWVDRPTLAVRLQHLDPIEVATLTDHERQMLDLERQLWSTAAGKEDAIRTLDLTPTRYYQLLNQLVESESALAYAPPVVNRLRRIRSRPSRPGCKI